MPEQEEYNATNELAELKGHYAQVPKWVILAGTAEAVKMYAYLQASFGGLPKGIFPSQARMAADLGVSESTVKRWLDDVRLLGALTSQRRGLGLTNIYHLVWKEPKKEESE